MVHEENTIVNLTLEKDLIFKVNLGYEKLKELFIDETFDERSKVWGPDAAQLLAMAMLACLNASFLFCLHKRNLTVDDLDAQAEISFKKNEKGYIRVKKIDVRIIPKTSDPATLKRIEQCMKKIKDDKMFFEESCIITASVREGIEVAVNIEI
ncbi:MAG: OsmC family peroxiredoxin [Promethearchaeota archaeon]|nr:MAG: OsmC family peroxiredoxin [Candidatus Lokiarchaeota archaeon]